MKYLVKLYKEPEKASNLDEIMLFSGGNTGNIVWYESAKSSIWYDRELLYTELLSPEDHWKNTASPKYLIPMANHIQIKNGLLELLEDRLIQNGKEEFVLIGLGSQLTEELNTPQKLVDALPKPRKEALRKIAHQCTTIGVRGAITAECLDMMGIGNYRIIGCPSYYSAPHAIEELCDKQRNRDLRGGSINLSGYFHKGLGHFLDLFKAYHEETKPVWYVLQDMMDFPKVIFENLPVSDRHMRERFRDTKWTSHEFTNWIKTRGRIFSDLQAWKDFFLNNSLDFSVGGRFHGNMAALLSGVPAVWIVHDSRTLELCESLHLPYVMLDKIGRFRDLEELLGIAAYNSAFKDNYKILFREYQSFLKENGLTYRSGEGMNNEYFSSC